MVSGWLIKSPSSARTDAVAERLKTSRAVAPPLFRLEVTNVLRTACKRQQLLAAQAHGMLTALTTSPI